jgi:hypothetical protein
MLEICSTPGGFPLDPNHFAGYIKSRFNPIQGRPAFYHADRLQTLYHKPLYNANPKLFAPYIPMPNAGALRRFW